MGLIYRYSHPFNDKGYVGKTELTLEERDRDRFKPSAMNDSKTLKDAIAKYGKKHFRVDIIQDGIMHPEILNLRERYWIRYFDDYRNGYNQTLGGEGFGSGEQNPMFGNGHKVSGENNYWYGKKRPEHSKKMSGKQNPMFGNGYKVSGENNGMFGKPRTDEVKAKISKKVSGENNPHYGKRGEETSFYGKKHSLESRQKISEKVKGKNNPMFGRRLTGKDNGMYGKKHRAETIQKISDIKMGKSKRNKDPKARPEYAQARWFFFLEIAPMKASTGEKRKQLFKCFEGVPRTTLYKWFRKWQKELET